MLEVVYEVPVYKDEPPEEAAYHFTSPELAVAPSDTVPVPHLLAGVEPLMVGKAFKVVKEISGPYPVPMLLVA